MRFPDPPDPTTNDSSVDTSSVDETDEEATFPEDYDS
jgi:hypothetical protein